MRGKIITEFVALRPKTYAYLNDDGNDHKKAKGTKKMCNKTRNHVSKFQRLFNQYKNVYRSQEIFKSYNYDVYTEEVNKIALSSNDDERLQTSDRMKTYPYGTNAFKVCEGEVLMLKRFILGNIKMINFDNYVNENKTKHNKNWPYIPDHPYRILIIGSSVSGKTNLLLNLIENQPGIDKIYLYAKDPYESKYQHLINKREGVGIKHFNDSKAFIEHSNDMHDV